MMDLSWVWLVCLVITHAVAYYLGCGDGQAQEGPSDEAWVEVQRHEIDMKYALMMCEMDERSRKDE